ncbi:DUF2273 domain-containing protein [Furfurilactobacillus sp. WILCCON 0119]|uniref:DUF2273 domain-containing protein n=1 Tax=Furfurilactobacillus entadae TaxID=2922307 RepID=UPI0035EF7CFC
MNRMMFGTIVGLALGLAWIIDGFWSMVLVLAMALIGGLVGKYLRLDRTEIKQRINRFLSN